MGIVVRTRWSQTERKREKHTHRRPLPISHKAESESILTSSEFRIRGIGERRLWIAVLLEAAETLWKNGSDPKWQLEKAIWFFKSEAEKIGSFLWICLCLGLQPEQIRRWALDPEKRNGGAKMIEQIKEAVNG